MKKFIVAMSMITALGIISCQNTTKSSDPAQDSTRTEKSASNPNRPDNNVDNPRAQNTTDPAYTQGAVLVANANCKTCHAIDKKMIGPSYNMIADKYSNTEGYQEELAYKIIKGGYGRWGSVAMPAHTNISLNDAKIMAAYVLSLKSK